MKRIQLYLDDAMGQTLHDDAQTRGTTIADLIRQAVRSKYSSNPTARMEAMRNFVGIRKNRLDISDSTEYIRNLQRGNPFVAR